MNKANINGAYLLINDNKYIINDNDIIEINDDILKVNGNEIDRDFKGFDLFICENQSINAMILAKNYRSTDINLNIFVEKYSNLFVNIFGLNEKEDKESINYYIKENANVFINNLKIDDNICASDIHLYLAGERSNAVINNSIINASGLKQRNNFVIHHNAKRTKSELIGYGVSKNSSELVMDTNGIIKNGCYQSEIHQKTKGIILDLESKISASPILEIDEFDVEASHGASIGAIDDGDLFYLMSRGLKKNEAEELIIYGFFNPYLSKISNEDIKKDIQKEINKHLI